MANVEEAREKYLEAKKNVENCIGFLSGLQKKSDDLQGGLPEIDQKIEFTEKAKRDALDAFVLHADKSTESGLKQSKQAYDMAIKQRTENSELVEACERGLKQKQLELQRLHIACDLQRRQVWQAVFDEILAGIPVTVFDSVKQLQIVGIGCSQTRQWILNSLFPNPSSGEFQEIQKQIAKQYQFDS